MNEMVASNAYGCPGCGIWKGLSSNGVEKVKDHDLLPRTV
jgi:hypothetical protein